LQLTFRISDSIINKDNKIFIFYKILLEANKGISRVSSLETAGQEKYLLMKRSLFLRVTLLALPLFVASCTVGPNYSTPKVKIVNQWLDHFSVQAQPGRVVDEYWWKNFNDPILDQLIDAAYKGNLSLQAAGVRILEARAKLNKSIGNLFPQQQTISGGVDYSKTTTKHSVLNSEYSTSQALFASSWEIDIWGKYRRSIESDRAVFLGSIAAYDDALVTLIADVASSYMNICTMEERLNVAAQNVETQKESLRIATAQFNAGETTERDMQMASAQLEQTQAQIPQIEETLRQAKNGLALLLGDTSDEIDKILSGPSHIPATPATVTVGIPHDLLRRRPDIRSAGFAAASKSALIGVAKADLYPSFSLAGSFGASGSNAGKSDALDMFNWQTKAANAGASLVFPIFNYGRLENQVRVQDAQFQEAILNYQNIVLMAAQEVENGLTAFDNQQRVAQHLTSAVKAAKRSTELAIIQYKSGQTDYTTVLNAEQAQLATEDALVTTRGNVALGLVAVYRALGGGWQIRKGHDVISDEVKTEMARRTNWGEMLEPGQHLPSTLWVEESSENKDRSSTETETGGKNL